MGKLEKLEQDIRSLSAEELARFRAWFVQYDWETWDQQLERDVEGGKLDRLADEALREHASGRTKPL